MNTVWKFGKGIAESFPDQLTLQCRALHGVVVHVAIEVEE
jgi:hypothetical protein